MLEPIEFPEFHYDAKLQQQLTELQGKYSKLRTTRNILLTVLIIGGSILIISFAFKHRIASLTPTSAPIKDENEDLH